jgi:hypothetical protein
VDLPSQHGPVTPCAIIATIRHALSPRQRRLRVGSRYRDGPTRWWGPAHGHSRTAARITTAMRRHRHPHAAVRAKAPVTRARRGTHAAVRAKAPDTRETGNTRGSAQGRPARARPNKALQLTRLVPSLATSTGCWSMAPSGVSPQGVGRLAAELCSLSRFVNNTRTAPKPTEPRVARKDPLHACRRRNAPTVRGAASLWTAALARKAMLRSVRCF